MRTQTSDLEFHSPKEEDFMRSRVYFLKIAFFLAASVISMSGTAPATCIGNDDCSAFVEVTAPAHMEAGRRYPVTIRVENTGTATWSESTLHRLAIPGTFPDEDTAFGAARLHLMQDVAPQEIAILQAQLKAPETPGLYSFQWRMVREWVAWFGPISPAMQVNVHPIGTELKDALFLGQQVPTAIEAGKSYQASITMQNIGSTIWTEESLYRLAIPGTFPWDTSPFGSVRVHLPAAVSVEPGEQYTFVVDLVAPMTIGTYSMQWRMVHEGVTWFGAATSTVSIEVLPVATGNSAQYISHSFIAPLDTVTGGQEFTRVVRMRNTGDSVWSETQGHRLALWYTFPWASGDDNPLGTVRVKLPTGVVVAPGQEYEYEIPMKAPTTGGTFALRWRMVQEGVMWFGSFVPTVQVQATPSCGGTSDCIPAPIMLTTMYTWFPAPHDDVTSFNSPETWIYDPPDADGSQDLSYWKRNLRDVRSIGVDGIFFIAHHYDPSFGSLFDGMAGAHSMIRQAIKEEDLSLKVSLLVTDALWWVDDELDPSVLIDPSATNYVEYLYNQLIKPYFEVTPSELWLTHDGVRIEHGGRPHIYFWGTVRDLANFEAALHMIRTQFTTDFGVCPFFSLETGLYNEVQDQSLADAVIGWNSVIGGMFFNDVNGFSVSSVGVGANDQLIRPWNCHADDPVHPGYNPDGPSIVTIKFRNGNADEEAGFIREEFQQIPLDVDWIFLQDANEKNEGTTFLRARNFPRNVNPVFFRCAPEYYLGEPREEVRARYDAADNGEYLSETYYIEVLRELVASRFPHKAIPH